MFTPLESEVRGWPGVIEGDRVIQLAAQTLGAAVVGIFARERRAEHLLDVNERVGRLAELQDERAALLQGDVGGPLQQVSGNSVGDGAERSGAAGDHGHPRDGIGPRCDRRPDLVQVIGVESLDRGVRADRHELGRVDDPMGHAQSTEPGASRAIGRRRDEDLEAGRSRTHEGVSEPSRTDSSQSGGISASGRRRGGTS